MMSQHVDPLFWVDRSFQGAQLYDENDFWFKKREFPQLAGGFRKLLVQNKIVFGQKICIQ